MQKESRSLELIRDRVKRELAGRDMSIQDLAVQTGLSRPWLSNFLNGKVALSFADADILADFFGVSLPDFISEKILA